MASRERARRPTRTFRYFAEALPPRPTRICPRVVKRAISKHRAKGAIDRTNYQAAITINILTKLTADP